MNKDYEVYEMREEMLAKLRGELTEESAELREDAARFDGYQKAFEEAKEALAKAERPNARLRIALQRIEAIAADEEIQYEDAVDKIWQLAHDALKESA